MKTCRIMTVLLLLDMSGGGASAADAPPAVAGNQDRRDAQDNAAMPAAARGNDQLILDATIVTGNRELPKVMYIVPWKKAELGDLPGQPFNTLLDETLTPVDREVFRREVDYYRIIADKDRAPAAPLPGRPATPADDRK